jgi:hypothetical protein
MAQLPRLCGKKYSIALMNTMKSIKTEIKIKLIFHLRNTLSKDRRNTLASIIA